MSKRYLTLGTDVLDTQGYDVIATAKSDALAQHIAEEMNKAAELEQVKVERDAMREALKNLATLGTTISDSDYAKGWNHAVCVMQSFAKDTLKDAK